MVVYGRDFYENRYRDTVASAEAVAAIVNEVYPVGSVIDVGCGVGTWLAVFRKLGAGEVVGIDGPWVDRQYLRIPADCFFPQNLTEPVAIDRNFDLAISLEVAEHLPAEFADPFVETLTRLAPAVLFSAAIPLQGGINHVNEQWPRFWVDLFKGRGYLAIDLIRKRIWDNPGILTHYAQNMLLFVKEELVQGSPLLQDEYNRSFQMPLNVVHPRMFVNNMNSMRLENMTWKQAARTCLASLWKKCTGRRPSVSLPAPPPSCERTRPSTR